MENTELLERVLTGSMDDDLRHDIIRFIFKDAARRTTAIPQLKDWSSELDSEGIYARMAAVAGGKGSDVAELLGVTRQAINNQRARRTISGNTIIEFHLLTGVSLDWLVGSWSGDIDDYGKRAAGRISK